MRVPEMIEVTGFLLKHLYELMADDYRYSSENTYDQRQEREFDPEESSLSSAHQLASSFATSNDRDSALWSSSDSEDSERSSLTGGDRFVEFEPDSGEEDDEELRSQTSSALDSLAWSSSSSSNDSDTRSAQSGASASRSRHRSQHSRVGASNYRFEISSEQATNHQIVSFLTNNHLPDLICETFIETLFICVFLTVTWIFAMIIQLHCQQLQEPAKLFYCQPEGNAILEDAPTLGHRIDRLEFELRKSIHQLRGSLVGGASAPTATFGDQVDSKFSALVSRLELLEKFIATTTRKLYETEERVKQLEKCECRLSCKWTSVAHNDTAKTSSVRSSAITLSDRPANNRTQDSIVSIKADGDTWKNNCDVCSCTRGHVKCRHVSCPALSCPDPHHVSGSCCPVCYKSCMYRDQSIRHGNKLVINSNTDTCKECLCIDGRLKCQRVELDRRYEDSTSAAYSRSQRSARLPFSDEDDDGDTLDYHQPLYANLQKDISDSGANYEEFQDDGRDNARGSHEAGASGAIEHDQRVQRSVRHARHRSRSPSDDPAHDFLHAALVCPQIDCPSSEQMRLKNDCCTYCKGFDFCSHKVFKSRCHPDAICTNRANSSALNDTSTDTPLPVDQLPGLSSMFGCRCKSGFTGDGHFCRDVDECADRKTNDCDSKTTTCFNLPGTYECRCKKGYKVSNQYPETGGSEQNSTAAVALDDRLELSGPKSQSGQLRECQDINECSDGKLNRCHPQAKCINIRGSYKCRCRRGFLGNGLECHQWFSSDPNVAAYLHRHSSGQPAAANSSVGAKIKQPLNSLDDPDDDRIDRIVDRYEFIESDGGDDDDSDDYYEAQDPSRRRGPASQSSYSLEMNEEAGENDDCDDQSGYLPVPKLSESKWEPLKFDDWPPASGNSQQANQASATTNGPKETAQSLNTRTMFFQPPPRFRPPLLLTRQMAQSNNRNPDKSYVTAESSPHSVKSDTNDPTNIQLASNINTQQARQQQAMNNSAANNQNNNGNASRYQNSGPASIGQGSRRGQTIVTSATTSPSKGYYNIRMAHSSSLQNHRSRTLGSAPSSATSISTLALHVSWLSGLLMSYTFMMAIISKCPRNLVHIGVVFSSGVIINLVLWTMRS